MINSILMELQQEAESTRTLLNSIPADKYSWRPHEKSMSAGELAKHIATNAQMMCEIFEKDSWDFDDLNSDLSPCKSPDELVALFDQGVAKAVEVCKTWDNDKLLGEWKLTKGSKTIMTLPRIAGLRSFLLNHLYHHRGQLTVYLRLLDVPVPSVYGPTADVNPFE